MTEMTEPQLVICLGELLIDFICTDIDANLKHGVHFSKKAGGAPANVCAAISRLGGRAAFAGKVGADPFGFYLKSTLDHEKVDTSMLITDPEHATTLAFVSLESGGERDFVFNRGADQYISPEEINLEHFSQAAILHFGSATAMLEEPFRSTYFQAIELAKTNNRFISFDPNYRRDLWKGRELEFIKCSRKGLASASLVKLSEEELSLITGTSDLDEGVDILHDLGVKVIAVTLGKEGTYLSSALNRTHVPSIPVKSIDSTGAGDAFVGALLYQISRLEEPDQITKDKDLLFEFTTFANKVGALACTKVGAVESLPTKDEVDKW